MTIVELVIFIAILGIAANMIAMMVTMTAASSSGDPMYRQQAILIAESYMEEILKQPFYKSSDTQVCPTKPASRGSYGRICDYHGLADSSGAVDQFGNAVPGLEGYNVAASVSGAIGDAISLGPTASVINNSGALRVLRVDVTVTNDSLPDLEVKMTGYRVNYRCYYGTEAAYCKPR